MLLTIDFTPLAGVAFMAIGSRPHPLLEPKPRKKLLVSFFDGAGSPAYRSSVGAGRVKRRQQAHSLKFKASLMHSPPAGLPNGPRPAAPAPADLAPPRRMSHRPGHSRTRSLTVMFPPPQSSPCA
jgi:hypothetical protein